MSGIAYRPYRDADEHGLRELFRAVYGPDAEHRTSAWRYLAPAPYPAVIQVAEVDNRIVGAQPSHAIDLLVDGVPVQGLLLLDVMTHPDYRRRGVFAGVVEGLRARAAAEGYRVLLTTPNQDAERGFARLPAWQTLGELEPWMALGDPATLVAGQTSWAVLLSPMAALRRTSLGGGGVEQTTLNEVATDVAAINAMAPEFAKTARVHVRRDARFIGWRFGPGSGRPYRFLAEGKSAADALVVTCTGRLVGRDITFLADVLALDSARDAARRMLMALVAQTVHERHAAVVGWFAPGSPVTQLLRTSGFRRVPRRLRPRPYSVVAWTNMAGTDGRDVMDLTRWHMTLTDSDLA